MGPGKENLGDGTKYCAAGCSVPTGGMAHESAGRSHTTVPGEHAGDYGAGPAFGESPASHPPEPLTKASALVTGEEGTFPAPHFPCQYGVYC